MKIFQVMIVFICFNSCGLKKPQINFREQILIFLNSSEFEETYDLCNKSESEFNLYYENIIGSVDNFNLFTNCGKTIKVSKLLFKLNFELEHQDPVFVLYEYKVTNLEKQLSIVELQTNLTLRVTFDINNKIIKKSIGNF